MNVIIRPARSGDIPRMADLLGELFSIESDFQPDRERQERGLNLLLAAPPGSAHVIVADLHGAVIGMAAVQITISTAEGGRAGLVEDVIVERKFRGKGIGSKLLESICDWSRDQDLKRLQLLADRDNHRALLFYHATGWSHTGMICLRKRIPPPVGISA
jgi:GNAT superfamily N-acetyltransferase